MKDNVPPKLTSVDYSNYKHLPFDGKRVFGSPKPHPPTYKD